VSNTSPSSTLPRMPMPRSASRGESLGGRISGMADGDFIAIYALRIAHPRQSLM
jgi:hypothetical protein